MQKKLSFLWLTRVITFFGNLKFFFWTSTLCPIGRPGGFVLSLSSTEVILLCMKRMEVYIPFNELYFYNFRQYCGMFSLTRVRFQFQLLICKYISMHGGTVFCLLYCYMYWYMLYLCMSHVYNTASIYSWKDVRPPLVHHKLDMLLFVSKIITKFQVYTLNYCHN